MKSPRLKYSISFLIIILAVCAILIHNNYYSQSTPAHLVLLLPDSSDTNSHNVKVWLDAVEEEGFLISIMKDSEFLRPWTNRNQFAGIIIPDQVHKVASDSLITTLEKYVEDGGKLMLVYDAGVWSLEERYSSSQSRFSGLAGVTYAHYNKLQEQTVAWLPVLASPETYTTLRIPPGKHHPYAELRTEKSPVVDNQSVSDDKSHSISGYENAFINYNFYETSGRYHGDILLQSPKGDIIAGQRQHGKGTVLFVNLPLGYLKGRTDGLFLHSFVHYFSSNIVQLPHLSPVPDGVGGVVMNWHLDSNVTYTPLKRIADLGIYQQGPYSIHITAGPDSRFIGDKNGINVPNNKQIKKWIKYYETRGYAVGSHGGWMHDRFGDHVTNKPTKEFVDYLVKNKNALEKVTGKPVTEYSAPKGNHPKWVTDWLSKNNIRSYYFTGNTGMTPTRSYRDGILENPGVWSFPILPYRDMAGFEELRNYKIRSDVVKNWLVQVNEFAANTNTSRLIYFHPRGALHYKDAMRAWLASAKKLQHQQRFRWYTMTDIARFLNRRQKVSWYLKTDLDVDTFTAHHADNLNQLSWILAKNTYNKPEIIDGDGNVKQFDQYWIVTAGEGKQLTFISEKVD